MHVRVNLPLLAALLGVLCGCGPSPSGPPAAGHPLPAPLVAKCEPGPPGGRLVLALSGVPRTFNPMLAGDGASEEIVRLLFASLLRLDPDTQEVGPALAESWAVEPDQQTWTFTLRDGLRWSDGQPLTAEDVVFTWQDVMYDRELNQLTYDLFRMDGRNFVVTKVDERTVRVVTPEVFAPFLEFFGSVLILPKHAFEPAVKQRRFLSLYNLQTPPGRVVGSGPFRVRETQPGQSILLERNPEYWVADTTGRRLPYLDEVLLLVPEGGATPASLFLDGKTDLYERPRPDQHGRFTEAAASGRFRVVDLGPGTEREFLWFNLNPGRDAAGRSFVSPAKLNWFRQRAFRQAVSCAIDRDRLVREAYGGRAQPNLTLITADNRRWHHPDVPLFGYDPARARALLAELDLRDRDGDGVLEDAAGTPVEFTIHSNTGNPFRERCAALIVEELRQVGLKANLQLVDFPSLVDKSSLTFDYEAMLMGLGGGAHEPASQLNVLKSGEALHQWFPNQRTPATAWEARVDELMDAQMRTLDLAERRKLFAEVQNIIAEELPMIYTVVPHHFAAVRPDLGNLRPAVVSNHRLTWNIEELFFRKP